MIEFLNLFTFLALIFFGLCIRLFLEGVIVTVFKLKKMPKIPTILGIGAFVWMSLPFISKNYDPNNLGNIWFLLGFFSTEVFRPISWFMKSEKKEKEKKA